jgi:hypothetical protein
MNINEKILKAVKEARKMLEDDPGFDTTQTTADSGVGASGNDAPLAVHASGETHKNINQKVATLNTATKEMNTDQANLKKKGKLKEKKAEVKPGKAVIPLKSGEEVPDGYVQPKKGVRVAVKPDAISNPEQFIADKRKEENS